MTANYKH